MTNKINKFFHKYWLLFSRVSLSAPQVNDHTPVLDTHPDDNSGIITSLKTYRLGVSSQEVRSLNAEKLAIAKLEQDKEASNANLVVQNRLMLTAILVAIISSSVAIVISLSSKAPVVNVKPYIISK